MGILESVRKTGFPGEVKGDFATRLVTATDHGICQILPQGAVFPRNHHDVVRGREFYGRTSQHILELAWVLPDGTESICTPTDTIALFKAIASPNCQWLQQLKSLEIPLIGIKPSIVLTYRDEYPKILNFSQALPTINLRREFRIGRSLYPLNHLNY